MSQKAEVGEVFVYDNLLDARHPVVCVCGHVWRAPCGVTPGVFQPLVAACGEEFAAERSWVEARMKSRAEAQREAEQRLQREST